MITTMVMSKDTNNSSTNNNRQTDIDKQQVPRHEPDDIEEDPDYVLNEEAGVHEREEEEEEEEEEAEAEAEEDEDKLIHIRMQRRRKNSFKPQRRVKVYLLKDDNWLDHGTGFCTGEIEPDTQKPYFMVRNELDPNDVILKAYLEGNTQYQRQQETLIVWTDPSGKDIALSFQETQGCTDLCEFIIDSQRGGLSPDISLYYVISNNNNHVSDESGTVNDITQLITGPINYPPQPTLSNLEEILELINQYSSSAYSRRCIAKFIVENKYVLELIKVFKESEVQHNLINLCSLSEIIKTLFLYCEYSLLTNFTSTEEIALGIIGILEYDAEFPNHKSCYRDFLSQKANFKYVIDLNLPPQQAEPGLDIFKRDFYLNFMKDVILARFIDDQSLNSFNELIHINQMKITDFLKDSENNDGFLEKLFGIYHAQASTDLETKRNGVKLMHQYVIIGKNLLTTQRSEFFSVLVLNGLLHMIKFALNDDDSNIKALGTELIVSIIEQDVSLVNSVNDGESIDNSEPPMDYHEQEQQNPQTEKNKDFGLKLSDDMTLMTLLAQLLVSEKNFGMKTQAFDALKSLLDYSIGKVDELDGGGVFDEFGNKSNLISKPDLNSFDQNGDQEHSNGEGSSDSNDISTEDYFKAFYNEVAPILYKNLIDLASTEDKKTLSDIEGKIKHDELLYQKLCELFSFCIVSHDNLLYRPFFLDNHIILGISKMLALNCKMILKLSVVRCFSKILAINDKALTRYFVDHHIIDKFFEFFKPVAKENNLANSTCLALLEVLNDVPIGRNKTNFRLLINYIHDNYKEFCLNDLSYVSTGRTLIKLNEQLDTSHTKMTSVNGDINTDGDVFEEEEEDEEEEENQKMGQLLSRYGRKQDVVAETDENEGEQINEINNVYHGSHSSEPKNLFEDIEKEIDNKKEKRQRDMADELDKPPKKKMSETN